jgi:hypothetical protein
MRSSSRTVVYVLITLATLLLGAMHPVGAQGVVTLEEIQVESLSKRPRPPKPKPPVRSVPEPSASLCLGIALSALAGYGWWSRKKGWIRH